MVHKTENDLYIFKRIGGKIVLYIFKLLREYISNVSTTKSDDMLISLI